MSKSSSGSHSRSASAASVAIGGASMPYKSSLSSRQAPVPLSSASGRPARPLSPPSSLSGHGVGVEHGGEKMHAKSLKSASSASSVSHRDHHREHRHAAVPSQLQSSATTQHHHHHRREHHHRSGAAADASLARHHMSDDDAGPTIAETGKHRSGGARSRLDVPEDPRLKVRPPEPPEPSTSSKSKSLSKSERQALKVRISGAYMSVQRFNIFCVCFCVPNP